jgi:peptidoglycan/LPS O-acetylase OafA/YrhL
MNRPLATPSRTFEGLDWMRFFLACYIMLAHTLPSYGAVSGNPRILRLLQQGNLCTSAFFMLSGFLLAHVYLASGRIAALERRDFLVTRMSALYPLHLFTFLLVLPISFFTRQATGRLVIADDRASGTYRIMDWPETIANIVNHLTLTHAWNPFYMVFNVPSWSISALLFFYIVFCFVGLKLFQTRRPVLVLVLLAIAFAMPETIAWLFTHFDPVTTGILHRNPLVRLPLFLAGIVLCSLYVRRGPFRQDRPALFWLLLAFVAMVFTVQYSLNASSSEGWVRTPFIAQLNMPAALALITAMTMVASRPGWRARWSARLGKASLSIFVLHLPLHRYVAKGERAVTEWLAATPWGAAHGIAGGSAYDPLPWLYPVYFVAIVALCVVFQERVANPIQAWVKRRFITDRKQRAPIGGAAEQGAPT